MKIFEGVKTEKTKTIKRILLKLNMNILKRDVKKLIIVIVNEWLVL